MESSSEVVSESPRGKEEAKEMEITVGGCGNIERTKKPVVVGHDHGEVASMASPAKTGSPKEIKKMKKKNKVKVSNTKKDFIFYLNLAKRYINQYNEVELCGLGMAIPTVITIAEMLKENGLAIQKDIKSSTAPSNGVDKMGRQIKKARIEIVLGKAEKLDMNNAAVTQRRLLQRRHNKAIA